MNKCCSAIYWVSIKESRLKPVHYVHATIFDLRLVFSNPGELVSFELYTSVATVMYVRPKNDFRIKSIFQDE